MSIWDLHHLLFLLANVATKWRAIGDGLHFRKHMLDTIGQKVVCIVEGPIECLRKILVIWLGPDKPPECDPTTVHVLALALRYPSVNEEQLASRIEKWPAGTLYLSSHSLYMHEDWKIYTSRCKFDCLTARLSII